MNIEPYKFQNVYLITTYRCNWACKFCLFIHNKEEEAPVSVVLDRLKYSFENSEKPVYLKITGGEPFLRQDDLLPEVIDLCRKYKNKIYKIGVGSNGTIPLNDSWNKCPVQTNIFLSRHTTGKLPTPQDLGKNINNPLIGWRINCNLIKGQIDSIPRMENYLHKMNEQTGIKFFCFRELSKISVDSSMIYQNEVYKYLDYYENRLIKVSDILSQLDSKWTYEKTNGNAYDTNHWYRYEVPGMLPLGVKFRTIDEAKLLEYNENTPDTVDEFVIHPDGTLTGCWDKEQKIIKEGYKNAKPTVHCQTTY